MLSPSTLGAENLGNEKKFQCIHCKMHFRILSALTQHIMTHTGEMPFTCAICLEQFRPLDDLWDHVESHMDESLVCTICNEKHTSRTELEVHLVNHSRKSAFPCNSCGRGFRLMSSLTQHLCVHAQEKPFTCNTCKETFRAKHLFKEHLNTHPIVPASKDFVCDICKKGFPKKASLNLHKKKSHANDNVINEKEFLAKISLETKQLDEVQEEKQKTEFACDLCKRKFKDEISRLQHINSTHKVVNKGKFPCGFCGRVFAKEVSLLQHAVSHIGKEKVVQFNIPQQEKIFNCCNRSLDMLEGLSHLILTHFAVHVTKVPPSGNVICTVCDKKFDQLGGLSHLLLFHSATKIGKPSL